MKDFKRGSLNDPLPQHAVQQSRIPEAMRRDPKVELFKNASKGDIIILEDPEDPVLFRMARVAQTTKTLLFVEGQRYQRSDGVRYGMKHYDWPIRIHPATKNNKRRMDEYLMRRDLKAALRNAHDVRLHEVATLEEGREVLSAIEKAFAGIIARRDRRGTK